VALSTEEEESIEALKRWWHETGRVLVAGIVVVLIGWFGWQQWQGMQARNSAMASLLFDQLNNAVVVAPGERLDADAQAAANSLIEELKESYGNSTYAIYAAMFAARIAVENDDLGRAEQELQWVLDNAPSGLFRSVDETLLLTARMRLARVQLANGQPDRALATISGAEPRALAADYAELRGDIYYAQGQRAEALTAYRDAMMGGSDSPFLEMKINELAADS